MRLRGIEVRNFRKLAGPCRIVGIGDGLTVIAGDNEEGKSSLLAALRAVFFERHTLTGVERDAMSPWGGSGTPEVRVEFEVAGARWRLEKSFRRNGCSLDSNRDRLEGEAAERRLQELLRFQRPGKGASKPEHRGLQALFWIEQGASAAAVEPTVAVRDRLGSAVQAELGVMFGGEAARALSLHVEAQCARFWTPQGKPRDELAAVQDGLLNLGRDAEQLAQKVVQHDAKVDQLARLRDERRRRIAEDALGQARRRRDEASRRVRAIDELDQQLRLADGQVRATRAELRAVEDASRHRAEQARDLAKREGDIVQLRQEAGAKADERGILEAAEKEAMRAERAAADALTAAQSRRDLLQRIRAASLAEAALRRLQGRLTETREADRDVRNLEAALADNPATETRLAELRTLAEVRRVKQAGLDASATRLALHPEAGQRALRDGADVGATTLLLTEPTELVLEGFGRIVVVPGGVDVSERRAALQKAAAELADALAGLAARDLADAERLGLLRRELESRRDQRRGQLVAMLEAAEATGIVALQDAVEVARDALERARDGLDRDEVASDIDLEAADLAVADAAQRHLLRQEEMRAAEQRLAAHKLEESGQTARLASLEGELAAWSERLRGEVAARSDEALREQLEAALAAVGNAATHREQVDAALRRANAETVREQVQIAQRALDREEGQVRERDGRIRDLEGELRGLGSTTDGLRLAELRGEIEAAERNARRARIEANAWLMLRAALREADAAVKDALLAPLRERLAPLLRRLFPAADIVLDPDRLSLTHLSRNGSAEPFDALSHGTREQIAVLVRLGLAHLLAEREGEAPCLILDDALVYADETRFETMMAILQIAARELQIIILTCRPRDYAGLDGRHLHLRDCVQGTPDLAPEVAAD